MPWLKLVGGVRWDVYTAQIGNSINSANTPGNTAVPYYTQTDTYTSVRTGVIIEPTAGAVLLHSLQHLVQSIARAAHLDDRHDGVAA